MAAASVCQDHLQNFEPANKMGKKCDLCNFNCGILWICCYAPDHSLQVQFHSNWFWIHMSWSYYSLQQLYKWPPSWCEWESWICELLDLLPFSQHWVFDPIFFCIFWMYCKGVLRHLSGTQLGIWHWAVHATSVIGLYAYSVMHLGLNSYL